MKKMLFTLTVIAVLFNCVYAQEPNMLNEISVTVKQGESIKFEALEAENDGTPIRIENGDEVINITLGRHPISHTLETKGDNVKFYGDIKAFQCANTAESVVTAMSCKSTVLVELNCYSNSLTELSVTQCPNLSVLFCKENNLTTLDLSNLSKLKRAICYKNDLTSINIEGTVALNRVVCDGNQLIDCQFDEIFSNLPDRNHTFAGTFVVKDGVSTNPGFTGCNYPIAVEKKWKVIDFDGNIELSHTEFTCVDNPVNMENEIVVTVKQGETIKFEALEAENNDTPVRIENGDEVINITLGRHPISHTLETKGDNVKFYGDIKAFQCANTAESVVTAMSCKSTALVELNCYSNSLTELSVTQSPNLSVLFCKENNLTTLDLSNLSKLKRAICYKNDLTSINIEGTVALNRVVCDGNQLVDCQFDEMFSNLPDRNHTFAGTFVVKDGVSTNPGFSGCNYPIAVEKKWKVIDFDGNIELSHTEFTCVDNPVNMENEIVVTVKQGETIKFESLEAENDDTPVRIENGDEVINITLGRHSISHTLESKGESIIFYGDVKVFKCENNAASAITAMTCKSTALTDLNCSKNSLTELSVTQCPNLQVLFSHDNELTTLDLSNLSKLKRAICYKNSLTSINIEGAVALTRVVCDGNQIDDCQFDKIFSNLPDRNHTIVGTFVVKDGESTNPGVTGCNYPIAVEKKWKVIDFDSNMGLSHTEFTCVDNPVNMENEIILTVNPGAEINLRRIVGINEDIFILFKNGTEETIVELEKWQDIDKIITAQTSEITLYGDIEELICSNNNNNIVGLSGKSETLKKLFCQDNNIAEIKLHDFKNLSYLNCSSNNLANVDVKEMKMLKKIECYNNLLTDIYLSGAEVLENISCDNNLLSDCTLDRIFSELPDRSNLEEKGTFFVKAGEDTNPGADGCNYPIAHDKNWEIKDMDADVLSHTLFTCAEAPVVNMENKITVTVNPGAEINFRTIAGINENIYILFKNGTEESVVELNKWEEIDRIITAQTSEITLYGDIEKLVCRDNKNNIVGLSGKSETLRKLFCQDNNIAEIKLHDFKNLDYLNCSSNKLANLDVKGMKMLKKIECYNNLLTDIYLSDAELLENISCDNNLLEDCTLDRIFSELPDRSNLEEKGSFFVKYDKDTNPGADGCNYPIAHERNWEVKDMGGDVLSHTEFTCAEMPVVNMENVITVSVTPGAVISFKEIESFDSDISVLVKNGTEETVIDVPKFGISKMITAQTSEISLYGDIYKLKCHNNKNNIVALSGKSDALQKLFCEDNEITEIKLHDFKNLDYLNCASNKLANIDIKGMKKLKKVECYNNLLTDINLKETTLLQSISCDKNLLSDCTLDRIFSELFDRSSLQEKGLFFVKSGEDTNPGTDGCRYPIAHEKNWEVKDMIDGVLSHTEFTCAENPVNMANVITVSVTPGAVIYFKEIESFDSDISVLVKNGTEEIVIEVPKLGTSKMITAQTSEISLYGDIYKLKCNNNKNNIVALTGKSDALKKLFCEDNGITEINLHDFKNLDYLNCSSNKLANLDVKGMKMLKKIECHNNLLTDIKLKETTLLQSISCDKNLLSDCTLDRIFSELNDRSTAQETGTFFVKYGASTNPGADGCRYPIAHNKNWEVKDMVNGVLTHTIFTCDVVNPNMDNVIVMNVTVGDSIKIQQLIAAQDDTPVLIVCGADTVDLNIGIKDTKYTYKTTANELKVFGDVYKFQCHSNGDKVTGFNSKSTALGWVGVWNNGLKEFSVLNSQNIAIVACAENKLEALDFTGLRKLVGVDCNANKISTLDFADNDMLKLVICDGNNLSDCELDRIFASLPDRSAEANMGQFYPKDDLKTNPGADGCNYPIAKNRGWRVMDLDTDQALNHSEFTCVTLVTELNDKAVVVYPNPLENVLHIEAAESEIYEVKMYDITGKEVLIHKDVRSHNVTLQFDDLYSGVYILHIITVDGVVIRNVIKK